MEKVYSIGYNYSIHNPITIGCNYSIKKLYNPITIGYNYSIKKLFNPITIGYNYLTYNPITIGYNYLTYNPITQIEERSSQLLRNLSSCEKKAWKKIQAWMGSRSSLNFFQAFFSQLLKLRSNCEDLSSIWSFIRSSNICFIYLHSLIQ